MSPNQRGKSSNYSPVPPTRITIPEFDAIAGIFKKFVDDSGLKWWIIAAGFGAIVETLHIIWLAIRFVFRF